MKALCGLKNLFQTLLKRVTPAIRESRISIVSKRLLFNLEQCLKSVFIQFILDCRAVAIAVIVTDVINLKRLSQNELNNLVGDAKYRLTNFGW